MAELSRKKKYQELRDQLDEEVNALAKQPAAPVKLSRSNRTAQNVLQTPVADTGANAQAAADSAVLDELLGEVKQYNIDNGDRKLEDTQTNILRTLDEDGDIEVKRRAHMETMEPNADSGGTTMDINAKDIELVSRTAAAKAVPVFEEEVQPQTARTEEVSLLKEEGFKADEPVASDSLELFDLSADDFDKTIRQEKPAQETQPVSRKEAKAAKKARKQAEKKSSKKTQQMINDTAPTSQFEREPDMYAEEEEKPAKSGTFGNIILILLIIILIALIAYTVYLISKAGLIG